MSQNPKEATVWYRKAVGQGAVKAQFNLDSFCFCGQGFPTKFKEDALWFRKAADQGDAQALCNLVIMDQESQGGVAKSLMKAAEWCRKAAYLRQSKAQSNLGITYHCGLCALLNFKDA